MSSGHLLMRSLLVSEGLQLLTAMCQQVKIAILAGLRAEMDEIEVNVNSQFRKVIAASVCWWWRWCITHDLFLSCRRPVT